MKTLKLDEETGDIEFSSNMDLLLVEEEDEKEQSLRVRLGTNICEWFLNLPFGLDFFAILGKQEKDEPLMRAAVIECLLQEPRISEVKDVQITFSGRHASIRFWAVMDGQVIEFEQEV